MTNVAHAGAGTATGAQDSVTIGVAIAVPQPFATELQGLRESFGDPLASAIPTHVTLLPPTAVPSSSMDDVRRHLADVSADNSPFGMRLRGSGTFRPVSPVVFVQVAEGLVECEQVERGVRSGVLHRESAFYYHPHVTVAHDLPDPVLDRAFEALRDYEAVFEVESFSLYRHGADGVWRPQHEYVFGRPADEEKA